MSDYKLVPVEPTLEMEQAGGAVYWKNIEDVCEIYSAMLAAAPAVQGEPVGEVRLELGAQPFVFAELYSKSLSVLAPGTKLYAAPQPAEQQPPADGSLTPVPDELFAAEFNAWWEQHGQFCRAGGSGYECTFAFEAWRYLYPQLLSLQMAVAELQPAPHPDEDYRPEELGRPEPEPVPDVTQLVEALESLIKGYVGLLEAGMDRITSLGGDCDPVPVMEQNDPWLRDARAALAAHRKQGGEV